MTAATKKRRTWAPARVPAPYVVGLRVWRDMPGGIEKGTVVAVRDEWPFLGSQAYQAIEVLVDGRDAPTIHAWLGWYRAKR